MASSASTRPTTRKVRWPKRSASRDSITTCGKLTGIPSFPPKCYVETVNSREFRQRIQEIVARQNRQAAERATTKKQPASETSKHHSCIDARSDVASDYKPCSETSRPPGPFAQRGRRSHGGATVASRTRCSAPPHRNRSPRFAQFACAAYARLLRLSVFSSRLPRSISRRAEAQCAGPA
jgi:hypothetical protein